MNNNTKELYKYIGKNINKILKSKNIKPKELSEKTNIAVGTIRNIQSGSSASLPLLLSIANELEIPFDSLIHDFSYHVSADNQSSEAAELFISVYSRCDEHHKKLLLALILSFMQSIQEIKNK